MHKLYFIIFILFLSACSTTSELGSENSNQIVTKNYAIDKMQAERIATESLLGLSLEVKSIKNNNNLVEIEFSKPVSAWSWGEIGKVIISEKPNGVAISVQSMKRLKNQITGASTEDFAKAIFEGVDYAINRR